MYKSPQIIFLTDENALASNNIYWIGQSQWTILRPLPENALSAKKAEKD